MRSFWRDTLRQPDPGDLAAKLTSALSVPFVDYARGDGRVVGPTAGAIAQWSPIIIDDDTRWVDGYRGLFGLDTHDRFAGERAPAGPKYTRTGSVRQSWHDPLGFLGLSKVAPPYLAPQVLKDRIVALDAERAEVEKDVEEKSVPLHGLGLEVQALSRDGAMAAIYDHRDGRAEEAQRRAGPEPTEVLVRACRGRRYLPAPSSPGSRPASRTIRHAHLQHAMHPVPTETTRYGRVVEFWAAISAGLILLVVAGLLISKLVPGWVAIIIALVGYVLLEAAFRRRLTSVLLKGTLVLAGHRGDRPRDPIRDSIGDRRRHPAGARRPRRQPARTASPLSWRAPGSRTSRSAR